MVSWCDKLREWAVGFDTVGQRLCLVVEDAPAVPLVVASLAAVRQGQSLLVAADTGEADRLESLCRDVASAMGSPLPVVRVPSVGGRQRQYWIPGNDALRCAALQQAADRATGLFVGALPAIQAPAFPPDVFTGRSFSIQLGDECWTPESLAARLVELDYDNEFEVGEPGEFARRGGILDVFSPVEHAPVRIEFFGNTIDSMREFDPDTQRSTGAAEAVRIVPRGTMASVPEEETGVTFRDYLDPDAPVFVSDPGHVVAHEERFGTDESVRNVKEWFCQASGLIAVVDALSAEQNADVLPEQRLPVQAHAVADLLPVLSSALAELATEEARGQMLDQLRRWSAAGYELVACCGSEGEAQRFREVVAANGDLRDLRLTVDALSVPAGVAIPEAAVVLLGERELFGRKPQPGSRKRAAKPLLEEWRSAEAADLEEGCYAVHATRGICRYHGITEIETAGQLQEAAELEFADDLRVYLPLDQIHLLSRYCGGGKTTPPLAKLGGAAWARARNAAENSVWDLAADMLRMDALRQNSRGTSLQRVSEWEHSFAQAFPYRETPDQEHAIQEVLDDMAAARPMDRLLCGDVGYGKTEVAIRAAFRAVLNGKQVAVLVPTTVLAQQHYDTFRERMVDYPVTIDMLSRFRTRAEQRETLDRVAEGTLDIVVGTHRLVQNDVVFNDLGLLIVDEEQRFGVKHKERLKNLRSTVDILTMTATPIPRTLYFSISGIRNLSTIMTPPADRRPVTTVVAKYDETLIREAILREIEREGQVFFVHNRVRTVWRMAEYLEKLVPEARFGVGHGQMEPHELAETMHRYVRGEVDVLVCTTIIESGVDIPNANTILIDRADRFGLAELYQLRGRVGRYHHQAYAYFLLPPMGALPQNARDRLAAIRRYTDLGTGFKLALRDLEIRGAGNILGTEQSGHIAAVGFELYCDLLRRAIDHIEQGGDRVYPQDVDLDLEQVVFAVSDKRGRLAASIPAAYVGSERVRIDCYRELRRLDTADKIEAFRRELRDRFGPVPAAVDTLLATARIRAAAVKRGVHSVSCRNRRLALQTDDGLLKRPRGGLPLLESDAPRDQLAEIESHLADPQRG